ncbi:hypothetical protein [Leptospira sp. severe_002]|uniref:hypothetical protein n=1 Tax=Leptospira sp. severe_002 TaxID=2838237 RepID=UPI001E38B012|nr:hypothetical protein [Leptospira sp. severe_002]
MTDDDREEDLDPHREIGLLEQRIEQLSDRLEGCRKFILAARIAMALGGAILVALILGLVRFDPLAMSAAVVGLIGGFVVSGSNRSTAQEAEAEIAASEARRTELISGMGLRVVSERPTLH